MPTTYLNVIEPVKISNEELWQRTKQMPTEQQITERKWCWIGYTLCKPQSATERNALDWNPQGTRKRGREREPDYISTQICVETVSFFNIYCTSLILEVNFILH
jgi:hypothetical protein